MITDANRAALKGLVDIRNPAQLRAALRHLIDKVVTDSAGTIESPFTYLWDKDWIEFCAILGHEEKPR